MGLKKLVKKVTSSAPAKLAKKMVTVQAGIATAGLVKPSVLGIKSKSAQKLYRTTGKVTKIAVAAGAVAVGGAGLAGAGPLAPVLGGFFGKSADQGGGVTVTSLAEKMKSFTDGGEAGSSLELVRDDQQQVLDARPFDFASPMQGIRSKMPLILGGVGLLGLGWFFLRRGK